LLPGPPSKPVRRSAPRALPFLIVLLLVGCEEATPAPCPPIPGLVLDLAPAPAQTGLRTWSLVDPRQPGQPLIGSGEDLAALDAALLPGGTLVAGRLERDGGAEIFALQLDVRSCAAAAWRRALPEGATVEALLALADGGVAVGGHGPGPGGIADDDAWIARFGADGALLWERREGEFLFVSSTFEVPSRERVQALAALPGGGLAAAGEADVNGALFANWLLILTPDGTVADRLDLPRDDPASSIRLVALAVAADGRLLLAGSQETEGRAVPLAYLFAADGELLWDRRYDGSRGRWVSAAAWLPGGPVLGGQRQGRSGPEAWLLALDSQGQPLAEAVLRPSGTAGARLRGLAGTGRGLLAAVAGGQAAAILALGPDGSLRATASLADGSLAELLAIGDRGALAAGQTGSAGPPLLLRWEPPAE